MSYTSHGDLLGGLGGNGKMPMTKESQLRVRSMRNGPNPPNNIVEYSHKAHRGDYVSILTTSTQAHINIDLLIRTDPPGRWSRRNSST